MLHYLFLGRQQNPLYAPLNFIASQLARSLPLLSNSLRKPTVLQCTPIHRVAVHTHTQCCSAHPYTVLQCTPIHSVAVHTHTQCCSTHPYTVLQCTPIHSVAVHTHTQCCSTHPCTEFQMIRVSSRRLM
jgi:hypothetical protein